MLNRNKFFIILDILLVAIAGYFIYQKHTFICPNDYPTREAYVIGTAKWINNLRENNPGISESGIATKLKQAYQENHCETPRPDLEY